MPKPARCASPMLENFTNLSMQMFSEYPNYPRSKISRKFRQVRHRPPMGACALMWTEAASPQLHLPSPYESEYADVFRMSQLL